MRSECLAFVLVVALAFLAAQACVPTSPPTRELGADIEIRPLVVDRTLHGDVRFELLERYLFEAACEQWRRLSHGRIRFAVVWDYDERTYVELAAELHVVRVRALRVSGLDARERGQTLAYFDPDRLELGVVAERCPELLPIFLHELGHVAGVGDVEEHGCVMSHADPRVGRRSVFAKADRLACVRAGLCEGP